MALICFVDLTKGKVDEEKVDEKICRDFIGGRGLGVRILYERQQAKVDALGPENILGFTTGLLVGYDIPGAVRCSVVTKSPLTNTWGDSSVGGSFATKLKTCGYDGIFFEGVSPKPVYLLVLNSKVELRDATHLWGKDTVKTREILLQEIGDPKASVACIGPAGEVLSLISTISMNEGVAARSGVGAVMGAKRLKAIAISSNKNKMYAADEKRMRNLRKKFSKDLRESQSFLLNSIRGKGTCFTLSHSVVSGDSPIKNWMLSGEEAMPNYVNLSGENVLKYQIRKLRCPGCPVACKGLIKVGKEAYRVNEIKKPEYESMAALGLMCLNDNIELVIKAIDLCDRYGMDTIAVGTTIAFAMECYERGIITKEDTGGIDLTWGNGPAMIALIEEMGKRKGFGAVLADGVKRAADRIGKGSEEYAMHVGGAELPMHSPHFGFTVSYICDPTPARHMQARGIILLERGVSLGPEPEFRVPPEVNNSESKRLLYRVGSSWWQVCDACGFCAFVVLTGTLPLVDFISAATGWDVSAAELLVAGERIQTLRHMFNVREGIKPQDFHLPERIVEPSFGPLQGNRIPCDTIKRLYYEAMNWSPDTGEPSKQRLQELGLDSIIDL